MKINIIANMMRQQRGEPVDLSMLKAELKEVKSLRPRTTAIKIHISALEAMIQHKENILCKR
jgi:hypothetical protein